MALLLLLSCLNQGKTWFLQFLSNWQILPSSGFDQLRCAWQTDFVPSVLPRTQNFLSRRKQQKRMGLFCLLFYGITFRGFRLCCSQNNLLDSCCNLSTCFVRDSTEWIPVHHRDDVQKPLSVSIVALPSLVYVIKKAFSGKGWRSLVRCLTLYSRICQNTFLVGGDYRKVYASLYPNFCGDG